MLDYNILVKFQGKELGVQQISQIWGRQSANAPTPKKKRKPPTTLPV